MFLKCDWEGCFYIGLYHAFDRVRHPITKNCYFLCPDCKERWVNLMAEWARKELSKLSRKQLLSKIPTTLNLIHSSPNPQHGHL
jgi:hypothetical protein